MQSGRRCGLAGKDPVDVAGTSPVVKERRTLPSLLCEPDLFRGIISASFARSGCTFVYSCRRGMSHRFSKWRRSRGPTSRMKAGEFSVSPRCSGWRIVSVILTLALAGRSPVLALPGRCDALHRGLRNRPDSALPIRGRIPRCRSGLVFDGPRPRDAGGRNRHAGLSVPNGSSARDMSGSASPRISPARGSSSRRDRELPIPMWLLWTGRRFS